MHANHRRRHRSRYRRGRGRHGMWGGLRGRFFGPGELRLALISLLGEEPKHGYELMKQLEARSGGLYRASAGSVYPTLQQLEDEGLAVSETQDGKRVYQLTDAGRDLVEEESGAIRRIWRRADEWGDWRHATAPEAWEVARPAMELAKAALRAVASEHADGERVEQVRRILVKARRQIERLDVDAEEGDEEHGPDPAS